MTVWMARVFFLLLSIGLSGLIEGGCVSQTERLPYRPHLVQQDEGVWDEVKREFGWQPSRKTKKKKKSRQESVYSKMTRSVKGWFQDEEPPIGPDVHPQHWERINEESRARAEEAGSALKR